MSCPSRQASAWGTLVARAPTLGPPEGDLADHLPEALLGQRVGQHDPGPDPDEQCRPEPGEVPDGVDGSGGLRRGPGDVAADPDAEGGDAATDALAHLAAERERRVVAALGADTGFPLAVLHGVGLEGEDQVLHSGDAGAVHGEEDQGQHQDRRRGERDPDAAHRSSSSHWQLNRYPQTNRAGPPAVAAVSCDAV
jgi:hypothetical protein